MTLSRDVMADLGQAWLRGTEELGPERQFVSPTELLHGVEQVIQILVDHQLMAFGPDEIPFSAARNCPSLLVMCCSRDGRREQCFGMLWCLAPGIVLWGPAIRPRSDAGLLYATPHYLRYETDPFFPLPHKSHGIDDSQLQFIEGVERYGRSRPKLEELGISGGEILHQFGDNAMSGLVTPARWAEMTAKLDSWLTVGP